MAAGLGARGKLLCEYIKLSEILRGGGGNDNLHARFDRLVQEMDELGAWGAQAEVSDILGKLKSQKERLRKKAVRYVRKII